MKKFFLLILLFGLSSIYAQKRVRKIVELNHQIDSLNNQTVKTFEYNNAGDTITESLNNFKPLGSKYRNTGTWKYEYKNGKISKAYLVNRANKDSLIISYQYKKNRIFIDKKEQETRSKLKDGIDKDYGIDGEDGCIIDPEDLEFYKVWLERERKKIIFRKGKKIKEKVYFDYKTNPYNLIFNYDKQGRLIQITQINRITKKTNWIETFEYFDNYKVREREYYIKYWNKIPPKEIEKTYFNNKGQPQKIELTNSKDYLDGIIKINYQDGLISKIGFFNKEGKLIREHKFYY